MFNFFRQNKVVNIFKFVYISKLISQKISKVLRLLKIFMIALVTIARCLIGTLSRARSSLLLRTAKKGVVHRYIVVNYSKRLFCITLKCFIALQRMHYSDSISLASNVEINRKLRPKHRRNHHTRQHLCDTILHRKAMNRLGETPVANQHREQSFD